MSVEAQHSAMTDRSRSTRSNSTGTLDSTASLPKTTPCRYLFSIQCLKSKSLFLGRYDAANVLVAKELKSRPPGLFRAMRPGHISNRSTFVERVGRYRCGICIQRSGDKIRVFGYVRTLPFAKLSRLVAEVLHARTGLPPYRRGLMAIHASRVDGFAPMRR